MIYVVGVSAIGLTYAWQSGDWSQLALVPVACLAFGPWMKA